MSRKEIERQNKHWICKSIHRAIYVQVLSSRLVRPSMYIPGRQYSTLAALGSTRPPLALGLDKPVSTPSNVRFYEYTSLLISIAHYPLLLLYCLCYEPAFPLPCWSYIGMGCLSDRITS